MQQTQKYWDLILGFALAVIGAMALGGAVLAFTPKVAQMQEYQQTKEQLQALIDETEAREKALKVKQQRFRTDPVFVERIAHELGFAYTNELIYMFPDQNQGGGPMRASGID